MLAALIALLLRCSRCLPPGFAWWLGGVLGDAFGRLPARDPRRAREHLRIAYPQADEAWIRRTARGSFRHAGRMALWTLSTWNRDPRTLMRGMPVEGADNLRQLAAACRRGEGTMGFTGHFGNWELVARIGALTVPLTVIGKRMRRPEVDAVIIDSRRRGGANVVYQDDDIRVLIRELRAGRLVASLIDQDIRRLAHVFVPWYGIPACTPVGPATLAQLGGNWVVHGCTYAHSTNRGPRWILHFSPRIRFPRTRDRAADALAITAWMTTYQELIVRRRPEQWVWWHRRWATRPPGEHV